jgi:gliding motility-associated-like protein
MIATSENDCITSDSVFIEVIKTRKVYFPNTFTPNSDGTNDYFIVFGDVPNVQKIEKMIIFDRWGGIVFENYDFLPNERLNGWDGASKGETLDNGVFVYLVEIRFLDDEVVWYSGDITLLK